MESTAVNTTDVQGDTMQYYDAERHEQMAKGLPTTSRDRLHNELIKTVLDLEQVKEDLNSVFSENKESSVSTIRGSSTLEADKEPPIESDLASSDQAKQVSKDDTVTSFPPDFTPSDLATQPDSARMDLDLDSETSQPEFDYGDLATQPDSLLRTYTNQVQWTSPEMSLSTHQTPETSTTTETKVDVNQHAPARIDRKLEPEFESKELSDDEPQCGQQNEDLNWFRQFLETIWTVSRRKRLDYQPTDEQCSRFGPSASLVGITDAIQRNNEPRHQVDTQGTDSQSTSRCLSCVETNMDRIEREKRSLMAIVVREPDQEREAKSDANQTKELIQTAIIAAYCAWQYQRSQSKSVDQREPTGTNTPSPIKKRKRANLGTQENATTTAGSKVASSTRVKKKENALLQRLGLEPTGTIENDACSISSSTPRRKTCRTTETTMSDRGTSSEPDGKVDQIPFPMPQDAIQRNAKPVVETAQLLTPGDTKRNEEKHDSSPCFTHYSELSNTSLECKPISAGSANSKTMLAMRMGSELAETIATTNVSGGIDKATVSFKRAGTVPPHNSPVRTVRGMERRPMVYDEIELSERARQMLQALEDRESIGTVHRVGPVASQKHRPQKRFRDTDNISFPQQENKRVKTDEKKRKKKKKKKKHEKKKAKKRLRNEVKSKGKSDETIMTADSAPRPSTRPKVPSRNSGYAEPPPKTPHHVNDNRNEDAHSPQARTSPGDLVPAGESTSETPRKLLVGPQPTLLLDDAAAQDDAEGIPILCSERFIESCGDVIATFAAANQNDPTKKCSVTNHISFHDIDLLDEIGVDLEISPSQAVLILRLSSLRQFGTSDILHTLSRLCAAPRYSEIDLLIRVDTELEGCTTELTEVQHLGFEPELSRSTVSVRLVSAGSIAAAIDDLVSVRIPTGATGQVTPDQASIDEKNRERVLFLQSMMPTLSVSEAIDLLSKSMNHSERGTGEPWFQNLLQDAMVHCSSSHEGQNSGLAAPFRQLHFLANTCLPSTSVYTDDN